MEHARVEAGRSPLLASLDRPSLDRLLGHAEWRSVSPAETLFEQGGEPSHLHVLLKGSVELCAGPDRDCGILLLLPGEAFMVDATVFGTPYVNGACTVMPSELMQIPAAAVRELHAASIDFAHAVATVLASQLRSSLLSIVDLRTRSAPQRLGAFLLRLSTGQDGPARRLPWPKRVLAQRLGMTPETLSRSIQTLADNGLVLRGRRIVVRDHLRVARFCGLNLPARRRHRLLSRAV